MMCRGQWGKDTKENVLIGKVLWQGEPSRPQGQQGSLMAGTQGEWDSGVWEVSRYQNLCGLVGHVEIWYYLKSMGSHWNAFSISMPRSDLCILEIDGYMLRRLEEDHSAPKEPASYPFLIMAMLSLLVPTPSWFWPLHLIFNHLLDMSTWQLRNWGTFSYSLQMEPGKIPLTALPTLAFIFYRSSYYINV